MDLNDVQAKSDLGYTDMDRKYITVYLYDRWNPEKRTVISFTQKTLQKKSIHWHC